MNLGLDSYMYCYIYINYVIYVYIIDINIIDNLVFYSTCRIRQSNFIIKFDNRIRQINSSMKI